MAVLTGASSVDNLFARCPCKPAFPSPDVYTRTRFSCAGHSWGKPVSAYTNSPRRNPGPLRLRLSKAAARSSGDDLDSSSGDGSPVGERTASAEKSSSSESQSGAKIVDASEEAKSGVVQSAFERAAAYKKLKSGGLSTDLPSQSGPRASASARPVSDLPDVEIISGSQNVQARMEPAGSDPSTPSSPSDPNLFIPRMVEVGNSGDLGEKSAEKAADLERILESRMASVSESGEANLEPAAQEKEGSKARSALDKARAYREQRAEMVAALKGNESKESSASSGASSSSGPKVEPKALEIEIITREGVIKRKVMNPQEQVKAYSKTKDIKRTGVSALDFAGLGFADKKSGRQQSAGLSESPVSPPTGPLPEVQIITRDAGIPQAEGSEQEDQRAMYKPKVSTWGVFARPANISKTYGGGRTIRPGESLETDEEQKRREAHTQQLLADYRKRMGLDVDPKVKSDTEKVLKQADSLMERGRLKDSLLLYELAMRKMPPQSELHGVAALQAAVCLDSLSRYDEARKVYEALLAHPYTRVSKQARRFLFGFKAMEKLKVGRDSDWDASVYRRPFEAFSDGYRSPIKSDIGTESESKENLLPYALLLLFPVAVVCVLAAVKGG